MSIVFHFARRAGKSNFHLEKNIMYIVLSRVNNYILNVILVGIGTQNASGAIPK